MAQQLTQFEANRLRRSLATKLANEAKVRGVAADPVRKQYIFTIFLSRIIDHETLRDLPAVPTTPIEHHLADKICALYERHGHNGDEASTRYRDLADIVRIVAAIPFDAARLTMVLQREASRRQVELPNEIQAPSSDWVAQFPRAAAGFAEYPRQYADLYAALTFCSTCLDVILGGERASGTWNPDHRSWR